ncbi:hypothetical protein MNB_SV-14-1578 [hydrothermal vent metagenome]|uniref:Uncharacterized protein n=1 Tax=hydrothermal vent metagenome TaxID=652676 RepID=A0A1W1BM63_9ZZZZ
MKHFFKELYGAGIIFFYYVKWVIFIGLPILYYGLDYKQNIIMDVLWVYCFALITKDFIVRVVLKKK